jgi:hypothetical protein
MVSAGKARAATGAAVAETNATTAAFFQGFAPGPLTSFGAHQLLLMRSTMGSRDYMRLLLLIGYRDSYWACAR